MWFRCADFATIPYSGIKSAFLLESALNRESVPKFRWPSPFPLKTANVPKMVPSRPLFNCKSAPNRSNSPWPPFSTFNPYVPTSASISSPTLDFASLRLAPSRAWFSNGFASLRHLKPVLTNQMSSLRSTFKFDCWDILCQSLYPESRLHFILSWG